VNINYYPIPQQSLAQITPENIPAMGTPTLLELGEHIFYCINDFRGPIFKAAEMRIIAGNIAFLIKYTMNSYVDLPTVPSLTSPSAAQTTGKSAAKPVSFFMKDPASSTSLWRARLNRTATLWLRWQGR
jgi:hypothetical protein